MGHCLDPERNDGQEISFLIQNTMEIDGCIHFWPHQGAGMGALSFKAVALTGQSRRISS